MVREILGWLLDFREDGELRQLAKIADVDISGFRTANAPRTVILQNILNSKKSELMMKALYVKYIEDPTKYLGKSIVDLEGIAYRKHNEIPLVLIALMGSDDEVNHEMAEQIFCNFKENGLLENFKSGFEEHKKQRERETSLEKIISDLELKNKQDEKKIIKIEEKLERVKNNNDKEIKKLKKGKEDALEEKKTVTKDNQLLTQENHKLVKQNDDLKKQIIELEQVRKILEEKNTQLDMQLKEITVKNIRDEAQTIETRCTQDEVSINAVTTYEKPRVALVGRTVAKMLLGDSSKAKFVSEKDAVIENIFSEYEKVLLANFDLPFVARRRISEIIKDKIIVFNDQLELKQYLNQGVL